MGGLGTVTPPEACELRDDKTGARIIRMTSHPSINHNLFFLTSSFTPDQKGVVFASYRTGNCQYYLAPFPSEDGRDDVIVQLTQDDSLHGYSGVISDDGRGLYYCASGCVKFIDFESLQSQTLFESREGSLGECSVSSDGRFVVTAMKHGGKSRLVVSDVDTCTSEVIFSCDRTIIHPQFHPEDSNVILYAQDPAPRMWMIKRDGTDNRCLYEHGNDCFLVHETFLGKGDAIVVVRWNHALCRLDLGSGKLSTISAFNAWHIASNRSGTKVLCDTNHPDIGIRMVDVATGQHRAICYPQSSNQGSQWRTDRYALADDFARAAQDEERERTLSWMEMKADTVYGPQWTHPHPSFSPDERWICYTSDFSGTPQVYVAEIPRR